MERANDKLTAVEKEIIEFLRGRRCLATTLEILSGTRLISYDTVWHTLQKLRRKGLVVKTVRGKYKLAK